MYTPPSPISRGAMSDDGHLQHLFHCGWAEKYLTDTELQIKRTPDNGEKLTVWNRYRKVTVLHTTIPRADVVHTVG